MRSCFWFGRESWLTAGKLSSGGGKAAASFWFGWESLFLIEVGFRRAAGKRESSLEGGKQLVGAGKAAFLPGKQLVGAGKAGSCRAGSCRESLFPAGSCACFRLVPARKAWRGFPRSWRESLLLLLAGSFPLGKLVSSNRFPGTKVPAKEDCFPGLSLPETSSVPPTYHSWPLAFVPPTPSLATSALSLSSSLATSALSSFA